MKIKAVPIIFLCLILVLLSGCAAQSTASDIQHKTAVTDDLGNTAYLAPDCRAAVCYASLAECWQLAGGTLAAVTSDADTAHGLEVDSRTVMLGSVKEINLEKLAESSPDYVILSADLSVHIALEQSLKDMGLSYGYFRVDTFGDYKALMRRFCDVTGKEELYERYVSKTESNIESIKSQIPANHRKSVLLMRAYSTGIKAKTDDNLAGVILKEYGLLNIADENPSLLEEMSLEYIISRDPDYIFVLTMGNEENALAYISNNLESNPAWAGLSAVKNGNYAVLPKELFHYKPNERWDESYEYLKEFIFG